jgi:hypothetical protein
MDAKQKKPKWPVPGIISAPDAEQAGQIFFF